MLASSAAELDARACRSCCCLSALQMIAQLNVHDALHTMLTMPDQRCHQLQQVETQERQQTLTSYSVLVGSKGFCRQKFHFLLVKKCRFRHKLYNNPGFYQFCSWNTTIRGLLLQHFHRISTLYSSQFVAKSVESLGRTF